VLAAPWVGRDVDRVALDHYLTFMYVPAPRTIIAGVNKLEPGCSLLWREGRVERRGRALRQPRWLQARQHTPRLPSK